MKLHYRTTKHKRKQLKNSRKWWFASQAIWLIIDGQWKFLAKNFEQLERVNQAREAQHTVNNI